ncbi:LacI family DNA-binding transcriptional regulator [Hydrogenophaga sp. BPS33]|uniref:LacI family DNA-binding transcriptional regulator n=1 Tax=Hydrogenophaga sp. BPS33 TaxID=2651974 RepID=UPI0013202D8B|nr:LacI family DNA-binding transcriptional regulator [Hydrogenophaga sp. BPS33]QHE88588.1 LacI family transcriptional regulator [Hydrogenophaga sp. BPS33]
MPPPRVPSLSSARAVRSATASRGATPSGRATSYDVAVAAGVSQPTVSRCFAPESHISEKTRAHVLAVAEQLGYTPNVLARSLITRQSHAVGLVITRYTMLATPGLLHALGDELARAHKRLILLAVENDEDAGAALNDIRGYPLDGLISCATLDDASLLHFKRHGVPLLFFNRAPGKVGADSVSTHHAEGAAQLATALLAAGYQRFLCIGGPKKAPVSVERMKGFTATLAQAGMAPQMVVHTDFTYQGGHDAFLAAVQQGAKPDCVWCANDAMALGVIDACRWELGWQVPQDVAVAGFDDVAEASRSGYRLTTVRQPIGEMAARAVALLLERAQEPSLKPRAIAFDGNLVERASAALG